MVSVKIGHFESFFGLPLSEALYVQTPGECAATRAYLGTAPRTMQFGALVLGVLGGVCWLRTAL